MARRDPLLAVTLACLWAALALFVVYPLGALLVRAFVGEGGRPTLANVVAVLGDPHQQQAFTNSLILAALVGVAGTLLGFLFALTAVRGGLPRPLARLLEAATLLPLISPPFTTAIAVIFSFGPRGLVTHRLLGLTGTTAYGLHTTALAETLTYFPVAYLTLKGVLAGINPSVEDMASSLGASRARVFRTVTLPLAVPGFANAFLLLFAASLADFATPLILAGNAFPVLPTQAYLQITGLFDFKGGAVLSFALLVPALAVYVLQRVWVARRSYVTVGGRSGAGETRPLRAWTRALLLAACLTVGVVVLYFYALLAYASLVRAFGADGRFTLAHYATVFTSGRKAIADTLIIAALATPLGGLYGVVTGYLLARRRFPGRGAMEVVTMLNYALPGTIVGIAYLLAFNDPPLALTGGAGLIVACYVFRYSPTGLRATVAMLEQIDRSIEEASTSLGAGSATTFRRVTLPLVLPAFFAGLAVMFIRSLTAISATIFLISVSWTLITVRILENMTELALGAAAAFSVLVVAIVLAGLGLIALALRRVRHEGPGDLATALGG
ncbi:MAG: iron ABC transporter permease [Candidatus Rokubacteria bacterium]|nr:iron ABC transporter permease [Candidatus Rokubacteria bacterium]